MKTSTFVVRSIFMLSIIGCFVTVLATSKGPDFGEDPPGSEFCQMVENAKKTQEITGANTFVMMPDSPLIVTGNLDPPTFNESVNAFRTRLSLAWFEPAGATDSEEECQEATDQACIDAGHGGVSNTTVQLVEGSDGCMVCSGDCKDGSGASAIIIETGC